MRLIGFIKEYNNISDSISLDNLTHSKMPMKLDLKQVIDYLNQGYLLLAWMGYFVDVQSKELIAPDSYYTDGIWVWPAYLPYYLSKNPNMILDSEFIHYMEQKNFKLELTQHFEDNKIRYEEELAKKLSNVG